MVNYAIVFFFVLLGFGYAFGAIVHKETCFMGCTDVVLTFNDKRPAQ